MFKNTAGQAVTLYAVDSATGLPKTGDAANMVYYVSKDDGAVTAIAANSGVPTEIDSTNAKGSYKIALSQAETNADKLLFTGKSSTAGVVVVPQTIYTTPANWQLPADGLDLILVAGVALPTALRRIGATTAGLLPSGAGTATELWYAFDNTPCVQFTVDSSGNRTAVVYS